MSDIPEDVMKTARKIGDAWFGVGHHDSAALAEEIARALMAERGRCAHIAKDEIQLHSTGSGFDSQPARNAAWSILGKIQNAQP